MADTIAEKPARPKKVEEAIGKTYFHGGRLGIGVFVAEAEIDVVFMLLGWDIAAGIIAVDEEVVAVVLLCSARCSAPSFPSPLTGVKETALARRLPRGVFPSPPAVGRTAT